MRLGVSLTDLKHHRVPAPHLSSDRPNLPFFIEEILYWTILRHEYREGRMARIWLEMVVAINTVLLRNPKSPIRCPLEQTGGQFHRMP